MPEKATVFRETYEQYLRALNPGVFPEKARILGCRHDNGCLEIPFYDQMYSVSSRGVFNAREERAEFAVSVVLLKYVLMCPERVPSGPDPWIAYRDFKDAGPLISYFTANTNKTIESAYSGRPDALAHALKTLGGSGTEFSSTYDVSLSLQVLPRVPIVLNFNDRDDEFPASSSILFRESTQLWLDMECVAIAATFLAGNLLMFLSVQE